MISNYSLVLTPIGAAQFRRWAPLVQSAMRFHKAVNHDTTTDLRLCRYFGLSDGWWLRGQASYDTALARESMQEELALIPRCGLLPVSKTLC